MARNGSGTYSLPAGNPVVTGTTISSTVHNNTLSDIATALTGSLARDGQSPPTANLPMGGFKLTGLTAGSNSTDSGTFGQTVNAPATVTLPSASTVSIGAELTPNIAISGTTTITAFDMVAEGVIRTVVYTGAVPITYNATSMQLFNAASRTNVAGDVSVFKSLGSGNWKELAYIPATAAAARAAIGAVGTTGDETVAGVKTLSSVPVLSGGGAKFPATQVPSADANTLDNYKEGEFAALIVCGAGSVTMGNNGGAYTIIGNTVFVTGLVDVSAVSTPSGTLSITGLPVASGNNNRNYSAITLRISGGTNSIAGNIWQAHIPANSSSITVAYYDPATGTEGSNPAAQLKASSSITFSGFYMVN